MSAQKRLVRFRRAAQNATRLADFPAAAAFQESASAFQDRLGAGCWRGQAPDLGQIAVGCLQSPQLDSGAPPTRGASRRTLQGRRESRRTATVPAARPSTNKDLDVLLFLFFLTPCLAGPALHHSSRSARGSRWGVRFESARAKTHREMTRAGLRSCACALDAHPYPRFC